MTSAALSRALSKVQDFDLLNELSVLQSLLLLACRFRSCFSYSSRSSHGGPRLTSLRVSRLPVSAGRYAFDNLKKVACYLLPAGCFSEIVPVLMNTFLGAALALSTFLMIIICVCTVRPDLSSRNVNACILCICIVIRVYVSVYAHILCLKCSVAAIVDR